MFEIIKGVNIGQGPGNAFGGGIYGASCEIGFSNGPTKITLNVVSEKGIYQSVTPNVYSTPYNVEIIKKYYEFVPVDRSWLDGRFGIYFSQEK